MYTQVASHGRVHVEVQQPEGVIDRALFRSQLPRFYELKDLLTDLCHPDAYFRDFEDRLQDRSCFATFALWERDLQSTDPIDWEDLKSRAAGHLIHRDVRGRKWQQLFDTLAEASAYRYLKEFEGCSTVRLIPASNDDQTPNLEGVRDHDRVLCEVKTINVSDVELGARRGPPTARKVSDQLGDGFFRKLDSDIARAKSQLQSYAPNGDAQHIVYFKICFDDWGGSYEDDYLRQIDRHLLEHPPEIKVVVKPDLSNTDAHVVAP